MLKKILLGIGVLVLIVAGYVSYIMLTTKNHSPAAVAEYKDGDFLIQVNYCQRSSICEGREFIDCPARYKCPIDIMLLKLRTKAEH